MTNEQKNIPELRFPEFDGEWKLENLGDLADIVRGASPRPIKDSKWFDDNSDIGWLRISDVTQQNGKIKFLQEHLSTEGQKKTRVLYEPHLLLSIAASVGKPVINYVKTGVHDGFLIFMKPKFDLYFMFNWLENFQLKWNKYGQPGSQVNLNSDLVKSQNIYIPYSYEEEKKMGIFFSKLDQQIELEQKKLELLEQQKRGYIQKVFSQELRFKDKKDNYYSDWKNYQLKDLTYYKNGKGYEKVATTNGKYNIINLNSIGVKGELKDSGKYTDFEDDTLLKNDLIMILSDVAKGNLIGMTAIIDENNKYLLNQRIALLRIKNFLITNAYFLYLYINFNRKYFINMSTGMSQLNINKKTVEDFQVNLPSIEEQNKIAILFKNYEDTIKKQASKVKLLKQRKQGLLQKMFV
ncbi:restriction endonuclease subunit S [Staphylococcus epidermidis]|uniref:restriction endonuclease subunit S n=1 Tax=Staphylococcus epidermidis TaxID=1282 RepID=UPI0029DC0A0D|nr:restriction endonuclease subunit S [Staphylococcus epidermidis]MCG1068706.1 restriction endonuclease subunit S [Staphylococcus epidermidis]MCG1245782.1 restriction endonuclease subunit S [Staphylococcus epidermidis]MCG1284935.1 restriction endonuclease subunit S [Staphylococcus epidermidis]MCG1400525.1 restriction endonuclease subunit S [Staphylococcus epidermidis]MCG1494181.1 restriction endonuclease subunit S [Staphylococcus epidermidis]